MTTVPADRVRPLGSEAPRPQGRYVLYWMIAQRRTRRNFALQHAAERARALGRPLLIFEPLRVDYEHGCARFHAFVQQGMDDNEAAARARGVRYLRYVEPAPGAGRGLLAALARDAAYVVTDDLPVFHVPALLAAAAAQVDVAFDAVDANGLLPFRTTEKAFATAYALRRHLQKTLPPHLEALPAADPLRALADMPAAVVRREILQRWPSAHEETDLEIDHGVAPVDLRGGGAAGRRRLGRFVRERLARYGEGRNDPDADASSGLSPYLHFGHVGAHEVFAAVAAHEDWTPEHLAERADGRRAGWWGMSDGAEAFLDQLVTWRELGVNACVHEPDAYMSLDALPAWAQATLAEHAADERKPCYDLDVLETARTHDEIWNAAQRELVRTGRMHNYLRMLWGKNILRWSASPQDALEAMIHLNDKYALDGRDPNSYCGILWCLGRHDRPWGPERPIFGKVRYMTSESTRRKLRLGRYLERFGPDEAGGRPA